MYTVDKVFVYAPHQKLTMPTAKNGHGVDWLHLRNAAYVLRIQGALHVPVCMISKSVECPIQYAYIHLVFAFDARDRSLVNGAVNIRAC